MDYLSAGLQVVRSAIEETPGDFVFHFALFGQPIRVIFPDRQSGSRLTPALAHLGIPPVDPPALTICCRFQPGFSDINRRFPPPEKPGRPGEDIPFFDNGDIYLSLHRASGTLSFLDLRQNCAFYSAPDLGRLSPAQIAAPCKDLLHRWLEEQGRYLIHAAGLAHGGRGMLLAGAGGSGKSTTAFRCLSAGLQYLGDDYVVIGNQDGYSLHSLYQTGKLDARSLDGMPVLKKGVWIPAVDPGQKTVLLAGSVFHRNMQKQCPLDAIVFPRIDDTVPTAVREISPREAYLAMAPGTLFQQAGRKRKVSMMLAELSRSLPLFEITLGHTPQRVPAALKDLLRNL